MGGEITPELSISSVVKIKNVNVDQLSRNLNSLFGQSGWSAEEIRNEQLLVKAPKSITIDEIGAITIHVSENEKWQHANAKIDHNTTTTTTTTTAYSPTGNTTKPIGDVGKTTVFASRSDPRFSYCLYVPPDYATAATPPELIVVVHDSGRTFLEYRDALAEFGRWNNCIILAPLFPADILGDDNRDGYKYIIEDPSIRYDLALLAIVDQVRAHYCLNQPSLLPRRRSPRFALVGYSGGGHFAHRFLLLHPHRLWAVSIGAPGSVTLLDRSRNWWVGTRDFEARFSGHGDNDTGNGNGNGNDNGGTVKLDLDAVARVPVQMLVGAADIETWEITHRKGDRYWMPGANDAGKTRPERLMSLRRSFEEAGIRVRFDLIPGMAHDGMRGLETAKEFLADTLRTMRSS